MQLSKEQMQPKIGFVGSGNMASSIVLGLIEQGWDSQSLLISSPTASSKNWVQQYDIPVAVDNQQVFKNSDVILVATKPHQFASVLSNVQLNSDQCLISVAAGISTEFIQSLVCSTEPSNIIRAMPNTPSLIGKGICGLYSEKTTRITFGQIAKTIFSAVGKSTWIDDESLMDVVTAVSGSGPAYFFLMIEAIIEAACKQGLDLETATSLAYETISGSAALLKSSKLTPSQLRQQVTSPGGTTAAAIDSLKNNRFSHIIDDAVNAATERGKSLLQNASK